jgi:hypothetical protein
MRSAEEQRRAKQQNALERMFADYGYLGPGVTDLLQTIKGYASSRAGTPSAIPGDIRSAGGMLYDAVAEDPSGFAMDALLAPFSGVRDFANVRQQAREARAAGDDETAGMLEQAAVAAGLSAVPIAGPLLARGARGVRRFAARPPKPTAPPAPRRFSVTPEETPGKSTGQRPDIRTGSKQTRARYQGAAPYLRDGQDVLYTSQGVPTGTRTGTGAYINSAGELEMNPVNVTSFDAPDTDAALEEIKAIEKFRGINSAQEAMAGNRPVADPYGNARLFDMGRLPSEAEMAFLTKNVPEGFGATSTQGGALVFPFRDDTGYAEARGAMLDFEPLAAKYLKTEPSRVVNRGFYAPAVGKFDADYNVIPTEPFSGEATMSMLSDFAQLDPSVSRNLANSADVRDVLQRKYNLDEGMPGTRRDIQNTRQFFSDPRFADVVELIRRGMAPAAALAALGYSAGTLAAETPQ